MYENIFDCTGKTAVVVGGSGLIGKAMAGALAGQGTKVYIADLNPTQVDGADFIEMDMCNENSVNSAYEKAARDTGRIDIVVNAAYPRTKDWGSRLEDINIESLTENFRLQLGGAYLVARNAAMQMASTGGGSIINIASIYGVVAPDFGIYEGTSMTMPAGYAGIKGGLIAFTKYLSTYYGAKRVRANVISPGGVFDGQPDEFVKKYVKKTPLGRMATPDDLVGATVFLASDASSYVTGQNIIVDGGWTAW